jgi:hypothetical protein
MLVRQAARDLDFSPGIVNSNVVASFPRTEKSYGPGPLPQPIKEERASLDFAESSPKTTQAAIEKEIEFRSAARSVEQRPSPQPPGARRKAASIDEVGRTRRNSAWQSQHLGILQTRRWSFKSDRSTLTLAAIILLAWACGRAGAGCEPNRVSPCRVRQEPMQSRAPLRTRIGISGFLTCSTRPSWPGNQVRIST